MNNECVILVHGLSRTYRSMKKMASFLRKHGYEVLILDYPSTQYSVNHLANNFLDKFVIDNCIGAKKIHFVAHSLGGIIVRYYLKFNKLDNLGRVIMLSPPNHGSELVDWFGKYELVAKLLGPAFLELSKNPTSLPNKLGKVDFELGVIAGNFSNNPLYSSRIDGENDGKVSIESAKIEGMKDFIIVDASHTFIMNKEIVLQQTLSFIEKGHFEH